MKLLKRNGDVIVETAHETVKETVLYCIENKIDLSGASLRGADLSEANLSEANLSEADLCEANLVGANLSWANLVLADLCEANLRGADLVWANLRGANLIEANLSGVNLVLTDLREAKNIYIFNKEGGRTCYAVHHESGLMIQAGCFWGTLAKFETACLKTYPDNPVEAYAAEIAYLKTL